MSEGGNSVEPLLTRVRAVVTRVLAGNWREGTRDGVDYAYSAPSPTTYPWQWYWDSCLIAIANRHVNPAHSRAELESLLRAADDDGFIGHTIFWGSKVSLVRLPFYNVKHRSDLMTSTIQPPLLAWASQIAVGDPALEPAIVRHHEQIQRTRDLDGDGLIWIIQPDESGLDASPAFDAVWGNENAGRFGFRRLVVANRKLGFNAAAVAAAGRPVVCEPLTNTLNGLSRLALGQSSITPALVKRLWDPERAIFRLEARPGAHGTIADTIAGLAPLALPDLPEEIGRAMVERHLRNPNSFLTPVGPPSVAVGDPSFTLRDKRMGLRQYWRGPTWGNTAWLVWLGLERLGYHAEAQQLAEGLGEAVAREGLREYYNPYSGTGMGAKNFGWTAVVLDMLMASPDARRSYIPAARIPTPVVVPPRPATTPAAPSRPARSGLAD